MTKVIKGEFKKIKDVKVEDVSLTCDTPLEIFNMEVSRLSGMDNDLFTYQVEVANIPCNSKMDDDSGNEADDDMGGDDKVELTDEKSSDDEDKIAEVFRIDTNIFDYEAPLCSAFNEFNYLLKVDPDLLTKDIMRFKSCEDYKDDWIYEWNRVGRMMDTVMEETYPELTLLETNSIIRITSDYEREELCEVHELPVCNIRKYMMIKYSFNNDEEYVAVKEDEYDDLTITREEACRAYQEIFWIMDEGWMVTIAE
ncbi:hypothetical protein Tco_0470945 [Tanacetum coccineum]